MYVLSVVSLFRLLLLHLIDGKKYLSLQTLNDRIRDLDLGNDSKDRPTTIERDTLSRDNKLGQRG